MEANSSENSSLSLILNTTGSGNIVNSASTQPRPIGYYGEIRELLWKIVPPILILCGTTGNTLTIIVTMRMKKLSSTAVYLLILAVSDTTILLCGPLRNWISFAWGKDIRRLSDAACKVQLYLTYASLHFSSWLLVAVTMERTISVVFPHKVKVNCTRRNACLIILALFVFTFGVDAVVPATQSLKGYGGKSCAPTTEAYLNFRDDVWQWIDFCMAFAFPFIFLVIGNTVMIVKLYKSRLKRKQMSGNSRQKDANIGRKESAVYVLMVALCIIFLLTMTPVTVYQIYAPYRRIEILALYKIDKDAGWTDYQFFILQHTIVNLVAYTNAAFNFVLYVFTGTKFRTELIRLFRSSRAQRVFDASGNRLIKKTSEEMKTKTTGISSTSQSKESRY
ncbi:C-C chemokine receptor type 5-like [Mercenaria mercenaria]|uniref:C-C chemokine receptor type 5-like n=1 Tax=Mercenaria mercenaria TaxID=6596 RepID=UPI00234F7643|nr:C-C chemokine receptor type 5-like [Mercenaria mercenaria]